MDVKAAAVPARRRRRGTRLSPLDPFFGMDMISPYFDEERTGGSLASNTRHMAIDIVEVRTGNHFRPQTLSFMNEPLHWPRPITFTILLSCTK